ncbi:MAG: hypothetical protein ABFR63_04090 [Thermodesulfobacteriota bacterium]
MSIRSTMPCWEINQCNKKESCLFAGDEKTTCWELVRENDSSLFHICVDCLVYLAKHEDSRLTEEEFRLILEQRKKNMHMAYEVLPARRLSRPVSRKRGPSKRYPPHRRRGVSI